MALILSLASLLISFIIVFLITKKTRRVTSTTKDGAPCYGFMAFYGNRHRLLDWLTDLLAAAPSQTIVISRFGARRTVVTANPDNVEHILKTNFPNYPKGKPFTDILGDLLGHGIFNSDGHLWLSQRKLAAHEFTARSLRVNLVGSALKSEADDRLIPFLSSACDDGRAVDLQDLLRRFAFDVICKISLGTDLGLLGQDDRLTEYSPFAEAFDAASSISAQRGSAPVPALWKVKRAMGIGSERRLRDAVNLIHKSVMHLIRQRLIKQVEEEEGGGGGDNNDMLSRLIAGGHSEESIRDMAISFTMAGRDTTSSALTWFFWLVSCHPEVEAEIVKEIVNASSSSTLECLCDYDSLKGLRFMEACLYESMRLYPPVVWDSKHAENGDVLPDGTRVEKGDRVTYFPYGMGRMERIWGKDWSEFWPTRWLESDGGGQPTITRVSAYKYPVFQAGPRVCLGREMAFVQMKYVAAAVLSRFEIRRAVEGVGTTPAVVPLLTAHMAGGLKVVLAKRRLEGYTACSN